MSAFTMALVYTQLGPGWDLIAHYLNGRSLANPAFYHCLLVPSCNSYNQNPAFYFESYRAPIAGFTLAILYLIFQGSTAIEVYLAILFVAFILAIRYMAEKFEVNELLAYAVLLSPVLLFITSIPGSEEIVSLIFLFIALGLLAERSVWFGFFLGLATLGKYPTLALLPMLLLLIKPMRIAQGAVLFGVAVLPWLLFSQVFLGGAFTSYLLSMQISHNNAGPFMLSLQAYAAIFMYPAMIGALALVLARKKLRKIASAAKKIIPGRDLVARLYKDKRSYIYALLASFFVLSLATELYIGSFNDVFTQVRYAYLLMAAAGMFVIVAINDMRKFVKVNLPLACAMLSIALFITLVVYLELTTVLPQFAASNRIYDSAKAELGSLGLGNCRIVSNDWVLMLYRNVSAFSQFDQNVSSLSYPVVVFKNASAATDIYAVRNLGNASVAYSSYFYDVLLPKNYMCYT